MRKSNLKTRLMAIFLTLCMALMIMPTTSFAEETNEIVTKTAEGSQNDYVIKNLQFITSSTSCIIGEAPKATAIKDDDESYTFYEYWEEWDQTENGKEPVKFWYSDAEQMTRVPESQKITTFEKGKTYSYSIIAKPNENYTFASKDELSVMVNGELLSFELYPDGKGLMTNPSFMTPTNMIDTVDITATLSYNAGDTPKATAAVTTGGEYCEVYFEEWEKQNSSGSDPEAYWLSDYDAIFYPVGVPKITQFEAGNNYVYSFGLKAKSGNAFSSGVKVTLNGETVLDGSISNISNFSSTLIVQAIKTMTPTGSGANTTPPTDNGANTIPPTDNGANTTPPTGNGDTEKIQMKESNISISATAYTYNGKLKEPSVTVTDDKGIKVSSENYTVSYAKGRKNVGIYTVTVNFKGIYSGTVTKTFTITPKPTSISKLTAGRKKVTVKWKKQTTQTSGYQIQYSTSSNFKNAKTVTVSKNKTTGKTISKLKSKKKYYVRIRTYKTVKAGGKTTKLYASWSKAKTVKVK